MAYDDARAMAQMLCNVLIDMACDFQEAENKSRVVSAMFDVLTSLRDHANTLDELE